MGKYCGKCGKENPDENVFCYFCGAELYNDELKNNNQVNEKKNDNSVNNIIIDKKITIGKYNLRGRLDNALFKFIFILTIFLIISVAIFWNINNKKPFTLVNSSKKTDRKTTTNNQGESFANWYFAHTANKVKDFINNLNNGKYSTSSNNQIKNFQPQTITIPSLIYESYIKTLSRKVIWSFDGNKFSFYIEVPQKLIEYEAFTQVPHWASFFAHIYLGVVGQQKEYISLINDAQSSHYIKNVALRLAVIVKKMRFNRFKEAEFIASFVQNLPYHIENTNIQYPPETIQNGGDCINKTILLDDILEKLGYNTAILQFNSVKHAAVGIHFSKYQLPTNRYLQYYLVNKYEKFYYIETTEPGWRIGQIPQEIQGQKVIIYIIYRNYSLN